MRVLGDGTQRVGVNIQSGAVGEMEHPNEIDRIARENITARHFQTARPNGEAIDLFLASKQRRQTRGSARFFLCRFQRGAKNGRQIADIFGDQKITPHEFFNRLHARFFCAGSRGRIAWIEKSCHWFLHIKAQALLRHIGEKMQMAAHMPEKIIAFSKQPQFLRRQHAEADQIIQCLDLIAVTRNPKQSIQITQTALALFQIGLDQITRTTGFFMPLIAFGQFGGHELSRRALHDFVLKGLFIGLK